MSGPSIDDGADDALAARLGRVLDEADPVPASVHLAALAALATRRLDDELAELVADSALSDPALVRAGRDEHRLLSFESGAVSVELQLSTTGALRGLVSGARGTVTVESAGDVRTADLDAGGWFTLDGIRPGPLRLRLVTTGGVPVVTSWVTV